MAFIELTDVGKSFGPRNILKQVNLAVDEGEFVSIVGTSGSGKTTLMKIASGLESATCGNVTLGGQPLNGFPLQAAIVFQNYSLLPWLSALENVRLAVESAFPDWPEKKVLEHSGQYLEMVGLGTAGHKKPRQLSGGMRQRVAIARAFAMQPRILFLDEPFGALDAMTRATLQQELARLCAAQTPRATTVMITNSVDEAILLSDRIVALSRGATSTSSAATAATLGVAAPVSLPRPRATDLLLRNEEAVRLRADITELLMSDSRQRRAERAKVTSCSLSTTDSAVAVQV